MVCALRGSTSITTSIGLSSERVSSGFSSTSRITGFEKPALASSARADASSFGCSRATQLATTKSVLKA